MTMISSRMDPRITIQPGKRSGQSCIRGLRITVRDVQNWLAAGMSEHQILEDFPDLAPADFPAIRTYPAQTTISR